MAELYPGTIAGDFFVDPLPPADLYSLGRILHDWSDEKSLGYSRKSTRRYLKAADC